MVNTEQAQSASSFLMLRPAAFGWNRETSTTNPFQARPTLPAAEVSQRATLEFEAVLDALRRVGVECFDFSDRTRPACPDAVFPNNWVSFHSDGTVVLYPMLSLRRRMERRLDLLDRLRRDGSFRLSRLVDLTHHELGGRYLEGTGSIVFDHRQRRAYACRSARTHPEVVEALCDEIQYRPRLFSATDRNGQPIYHTNVMMTIGTRTAIVCAEAVAAGDRAWLLAELESSGREVLRINFRQMRRFAGNALEMRTVSGQCVLIMSASARATLDRTLAQRLKSSVDLLVEVDIPVIESVGGGSVRCMLAEVFLPRSRN